MTTTMDRYNANWGVVEKGWKAHVLGQGRGFTSACEAIKTYYAEDPKITDQYMDSFVIVENGKPVGTVQNGDAVVFFNFRGDRAIEISRAFDEKDFREFDIAVECVDLSLRRISPAVEAAKGTLVVTADHGNADCMWTESKGVRSPMVAHTLNPVPFIVKDYSGYGRFSLAGVATPGLRNVAATVCNLLGYHPPEGYDPSLIINR